MWAAFVAASSFVLLVSLLVSGRRSRLESRLKKLSGQEDASSASESLADFAMTTLPKMGASLVPSDEEGRNRLQGRLWHAGLYRRQAMYIFLGVKLLLVVIPPGLGVIAGILHLVPLAYGLVCGALLGALGLLAPSFWLDWRKKQRQTILRRSLPDALDVL